MFTWTGVLDRAAYAWRSAIAVVFLIGTIFLFPFLLKAIVMASHCQSAGAFIQRELLDKLPSGRA
jgi:hypothetical protein